MKHISSRAAIVLGALWVALLPAAGQDNVYVDPDSGQKVWANPNTGETPAQFERTAMTVHLCPINH